MDDEIKNQIGKRWFPSTSNFAAWCFENADKLYVRLETLDGWKSMPLSSLSVEDAKAQIVMWACEMNLPILLGEGPDDDPF